MPRWSTAMTSKFRASPGIRGRHAYQLSGQPCTSSSGGPSPPMTACRRSAPASTYRLVNVSVNPSARFGACETEPGPSAVSGPVDDALMWGSALTADHGTGVPLPSRPLSDGPYSATSRSARHVPAPSAGFVRHSVLEMAAGSQVPGRGVEARRLTSVARWLLRPLG